jgi:hypothetical protein
MELTILEVKDETPKGLTTGFRLKFKCQASSSAVFELDLPILVSKEVVARRIPLANLALAYLERHGLEEWPNLFVDTRRLNLDAAATGEAAFPRKITLGSAEVLNQRTVEKLVQVQQRAQ